jgi:hypothetical protein
MEIEPNGITTMDAGEPLKFTDVFFGDYPLKDDYPIYQVSFDKSKKMKHIEITFDDSEYQIKGTIHLHFENSCVIYVCEISQRPFGLSATSRIKFYHTNFVVDNFDVSETLKTRPDLRQKLLDCNIVSYNKNKGLPCGFSEVEKTILDRIFDQSQTILTMAKKAFLNASEKIKNK